MDNALINLIVARQNDVEPINAFLNGRPGILNTVSFMRMAETQREEREGREAAEKASTDFKKALDAGTRKWLALDENAKVERKQRDEFIAAVEAVGDDAVGIIVPKSGQTDTGGGGVDFGSRFRTLFDQRFADNMGNMTASDFADGTVAVLEQAVTLYKADTANTTSGKPSFFDWFQTKLK